MLLAVGSVVLHNHTSPDRAERREGNSSTSKLCTINPTIHSAARHVQPIRQAAERFARSLLFLPSETHFLRRQSVLTDRVLSRNLPPPSHASRLGLSIAFPNCSTTPSIRRMVSRSSCRLRRSTSPGPNTRLSSLTNSIC